MRRVAFAVGGPPARPRRPLRAPDAAAGAGRRGRGDRRPLLRLDPRHDRLHRYRLAFHDDDLREHAPRRRRNLGVHLVGGDLEDRLVALHLVADLLQPLRQRALGDRFAHLGHDDVNACHCDVLLLGVSRNAARLPHAPDHDRWKQY